MKKNFLFILLSLFLINYATYAQENKCESGDCVNGEGVYLFANGAKYTGQFKDSKPNGKGLYNFPPEHKTYVSYEGDFVDGKQEGVGKFIDKKGNVYEGDVKAGKRDGKGKMTYANGSVYEGEWSQNKKHGKGKYNIITKNGKPYGVYEGTFVNNIRETAEGDSAKFSYASGKVYVGEFKANRAHGFGRETYKGKTYIGPFVKGKKQTGEGQTATYITKQGKYVGEFKNKNFNGKGTYTLSNGDVYEGEFANGTFNGQGTYTSANGAKQTGNWVNGKLQK